MRLLLVTLVLLVGCGPQFRTNYQFKPPATQQGQACVFQCENSRLQCQRLDDLEYERCQDRAEDRYERCEDRNRYRSQDDKEYCYREYCSKSNGEKCDGTYRNCYQSCGGTVNAETVCVANCEEVR